jgi:hypothetical protein
MNDHRSSASRLLRRLRLVVVPLTTCAHRRSIRCQRSFTARNRSSVGSAPFRRNQPRNAIASPTAVCLRESRFTRANSSNRAPNSAPSCRGMGGTARRTAFRRWPSRTRDIACDSRASNRGADSFPATSPVTRSSVVAARLSSDTGLSPLTCAGGAPGGARPTGTVRRPRT